MRKESKRWKESQKLRAINVIIAAYEFIDAKPEEVLDIIKVILDQTSSDVVSNVVSNVVSKAISDVKIDDVEFVDASVGSSWIDRFEYNHGSKKLTVVTQDDRVYTYIGVPVDLWNDLIVNTNTGDSAGMFYNEWIKGKYELA